MYLNLFPQLKHALELLNKKLLEKGKEIREYQEKHNIKFQVPEKIMEEDESGGGDETKPGGVLVGDKPTRWLNKP